MNEQQPPTRLNHWIAATRKKLIDRTFSCSKLTNTTLLAYFFWNDNRIETEFPNIECAFLCAYKCFGWLPGVLVVNKITDEMRSFCTRFNINILVENNLHDGVRSLCIESISNMHTRFSTEYVLTLQTDGMPVNSGIEQFLGKYDFIGAPWPGHTTHFDFYPYPKYAVGNGGFSLRSRKICHAASCAYEKLRHFIPYSQHVFGDDVFYCKFMPFFSKHWRSTFKFPSIEEAAKFSIESDGIPYANTPPIGFHRNGFYEYVKRYGMPTLNL